MQRLFLLASLIRRWRRYEEKEEENEEAEKCPGDEKHTVSSTQHIKY